MSTRPSRPVRIVPVTAAHVRTVVKWQYPPPYDVYNMNTGDLEAELHYALNPKNGMVSLLDEGGALVAFGSFGRDGQVPGGDYSAPALDIGLGVRPDLTGRGLGRHFVGAMIDHAKRQFNPPALRVTIAAFNQRAQKVWHRHGFVPVVEFGRARDGMPFIIFVRQL